MLVTKLEFSIREDKLVFAKKLKTIKKKSFHSKVMSQPLEHEVICSLSYVL